MRRPVPWPAAPLPVKDKPIWMVSLIDTFSLLLCFFILIFSMGTPDTQKFREIASSLAKQLPVLGTRPLAPRRRQERRRRRSRSISRSTSTT